MVESIKELRKICQNPDPDIDLKRKVVRFISIYVTKLLLYTPITANQVSFLMILLSFPAGFLFSFNNYWYSLIGIFLMQIVFFLDYNDGEVARYRKSASLNGQFVDIVAHSVAMPTALIGITMGLADNIIYVLLGLISIAFVFLSTTVSIFKHEVVFHMLVSYAKKNKSPNPPSNQDKSTSQQSKSNKWRYIFKNLLLTFKYPYIMFIMSILAVFNRLEWTLIILGVATPLLWIIYAWKEFKLGIEPFEYLFEPYR